MAEKVKHAHFNEDERIYLLEQIKNHTIIGSKKTDVGSLAAKKRAWEEITRNFNSTGNFQKRSLEQLKKHWNNVKARRKKELCEETRELMGTGGGPYKPHSPSCPEVEVVAPHINYHLGYQWDGDAVAMEDAAAKRRKISMSEVTAAFKSAGSTLAGTSLLEFIDTVDIPTTSASQSLSFLTPAPQVSGSPSNTSPIIQFIPALAPPPSSPSPPPPPPPPPPPSPRQPLQAPKLLQQEVLQKTSHAHEERAKTSIHADKELHCECLAEAKLNHQEAKKRQQRAEERHRLDIQQAKERHRLDIQQAEERHRLDMQQAEELHRLEMERLRLKMEFEAEMNRETLQAAKEKRERESHQSRETHRVQLQKLQGPSEPTE